MYTLYYGRIRVWPCSLTGGRKEWIYIRSLAVWNFIGRETRSPRKVPATCSIAWIDFQPLVSCWPYQSIGTWKKYCSHWRNSRLSLGGGQFFFPVGESFICWDMCNFGVTKTFHEFSLNLVSRFGWKMRGKISEKLLPKGWMKNKAKTYSELVYYFKNCQKTLNATRLKSKNNIWLNPTANPFSNPNHFV